MPCYLCFFFEVSFPKINLKCSSTRVDKTTRRTHAMRGLHDLACTNRSEVGQSKLVRLVDARKTDGELALRSHWPWLSHATIIEIWNLEF